MRLIGASLLMLLGLASAYGGYAGLLPQWDVEEEKLIETLEMKLDGEMMACFDVQVLRARVYGPARYQEVVSATAMKYGDCVSLKNVTLKDVRFEEPVLDHMSSTCIMSAKFVTSPKTVLLKATKEAQKKIRSGTRLYLAWRVHSQQLFEHCNRRDI